MKTVWGIVIAFVLVVSVLGLGTLAATPAAHADVTRDAEVRALEKIAAQLDRINDTLRDKCGR